MNQNNPATVALSSEIIPRGDGSFILKPAKPTQWLWAREAAKQCRVSSRTIIRWIESGRIKGRRMGPQRWQVDASSLPS